MDQFDWHVNVLVLYRKTTKAAKTVLSGFF